MRIQELHDPARTALLLIDVINDFNFEEAQQMLPAAEVAAQKIQTLKLHVKQAGIAVIYVNDNFGKCRSDFKAQVDHCLNTSSKGCSVVEKLKPDDDDYFVLKPKHSGFYSTNLEVLLQHLGINSLILTGYAGNICVMFTANDAYMRNYHLVVPRDCVASNTKFENDFALSQMQAVLKADIRASSQLDLPK